MTLSETVAGHGSQIDSQAELHVPRSVFTAEELRGVGQNDRSAAYTDGARSDVRPRGSRSSMRSTSKIIRTGLGIVSALAFGFALNVVVGSKVEHRAAQTREFNAIRSELTATTTALAPTGPRLADGKPLPLGTPMALIRIPSIGVNEVVDEGTSGTVLMDGPGHLRSSVFPGGVGTSEIFGRSSTYGGPFARLGQLHKGARITVTTQDGTFTFVVIDVRRAGARIPSLVVGRARLTLATSIESSFVATGVLWVDADLVKGTAFSPAAPVVKTVPGDERPLGMEIGALWGVAAWLVVLALVLVAATWTWERRGHAQAWITFVGPVAVIGYFLADQIGALMPNIM
jgi:sortase A